MTENQPIQFQWAENGNIMPCPYRDQCRTYKIGCDGFSYWCKNAEAMTVKKIGGKQ